MAGKGDYNMAEQAEGTLAITAEFDVLSDKIDRFIDVDSQLVAKEPGCEQFDMTVAENAPNTAVLYEVCRDAAAFDAHLETPHLRAFRDRIDDLIVSRRVRRLSHIQRGGATS